ncbi:MAG TPA: VIT1/CCC1 transporter family protein [Acidimicrobiales bacterium]|nr:VIT1/CCC1 transporter family protein [Acidimicrobiales bacterium]
MTLAHEHHHRNIQGGAARAAVFGVSDGLLSNVSLILGVAGANTSSSLVRVAGLAGLVAGAFSMAAGEYVSVKAQVELLEAELTLEAHEIKHRPGKEFAELSALYQSRGVSPEAAHEVATAIMADADLALEVHAREELGVNPGQLGSPVTAAGSSFVSFIVGAVIPLAPWFFTTGRAAITSSLVLAAVAAVAVGVALARFTGRPAWRAALRQLGLASAGAAVCYLVGSAVGVTSPT